MAIYWWFEEHDGEIFIYESANEEIPPVDPKRFTDRQSKETMPAVKSLASYPPSGPKKEYLKVSSVHLHPLFLLSCLAKVHGPVFQNKCFLFHLKIHLIL